MSTQMEIRAFKNVNGENDEISHVVKWYGYDVMAWLCGVRNRAAIKPLPHKHLSRQELCDFLDPRPPEKQQSGADYFSTVSDFDRFSDDSFYLVKMSDILAADLDQVVENRRVHGKTLPEGEGVKMTLREYLDGFEIQIEKLKSLGAETLLLRFY